MASPVSPVNVEQGFGDALVLGHADNKICDPVIVSAFHQRLTPKNP
jgi:hypothetical protein